MLNHIQNNRQKLNSKGYSWSFRSRSRYFSRKLLKVNRLPADFLVICLIGLIVVLQSTPLLARKQQTITLKMASGIFTMILCVKWKIDQSNHLRLVRRKGCWQKISVDYLQRKPSINIKLILTYWYHQQLKLKELLNPATIQYVHR